MAVPKVPQQYTHTKATLNPTSFQSDSTMCRRRAQARATTPEVERSLIYYPSQEFWAYPPVWLKQSSNNSAVTYMNTYTHPVQCQTSKLNPSITRPQNITETCHIKQYGIATSVVFQFRCRFRFLFRRVRILCLCCSCVWKRKSGGGTVRPGGALLCVVCHPLSSFVFF